MPAGPNMDANLDAGDSCLIRDLVGLEQCRDLATVHDVNQAHPLASKHCRNRWRARWISTPRCVTVIWRLLQISFESRSSTSRNWKTSLCGNGREETQSCTARLIS